MNFMPQYVIFAMCKMAAGDPSVTKERVAAFDARLFQIYGAVIALEARKAGINLDKRIASIIMLVAVMSKFADPRRSVPIAVTVYLDALRAEVISDSRDMFAPELAGLGAAAPESAVADLRALVEAPAPARRKKKGSRRSSRDDSTS